VARMKRKGMNGSRNRSKPTGNVAPENSTIGTRHANTKAHFRRIAARITPTAARRTTSAFSALHGSAIRPHAENFDVSKLPRSRSEKNPLGSYFTPYNPAASGAE